MGTPIMVTLVAAPIVRFVIDKLVSNTWRDLKSMWKVDTRRLEDELLTIMGVLKEAERSRIAVVDGDALHEWLSKLKDAAYDADDVVHDYHAEALRLLRRKRAKVVNVSYNFFSSKNTLAFRYKMNKKLKLVMKTLDEIKKDGQWHLLQQQRPPVQSLDRGRETSSALIESKIYGRDEDRRVVVNYLITVNNDDEVSIVAIVGLGGVGKTTLAQLVFNDGCINREFDREIWVWVSIDFSIESILRKIIEQITNNNCNLTQIEVMHQCLKGLLTGTRFLLVLDDVWAEDEQQWRQLRSLLRLGRKGSKILVTTRCLQVARKMGSSFTHQLKGLSNDNCWEIFRNRAFSTAQPEKFKSFEEIGKKITNKCGGLPLAVEALGSLMATMKEEAEWLNVQNIEMWRLPEDRTKIIYALKLSYHMLSSHLKQCFAYCSLFPKHYRFDKKKFVDLLFVEGFIPSPVAGMPREHSHNNCFDMFLEIQFFQDAEQQCNDHTVTCKMHDVVQDLAWSVAGDEFLFVAGDKLTFKKIYPYSSFRYVTIICDRMSLDTLNTSPSPEVDSTSPEVDKVRSLILLPGNSNQRCNLSKDFWKRLLKLRLLRVLDLSFTNISDMPCEISNLERLKLLNLSNTDITTLPDTITSLHDLLMLNLSYCRKLQQLPDGLSNMRSLLQLDIYDCHKLSSMPSRIGHLSKLQLLAMFIVGDEDGHTITELQHLNDISGRLQIKNLHNVTNQIDAHAANLRGKKHLRYLELYWDSECQNVEAVAESLQPHQNLEGLTISGYKGNNFPSWMSKNVQTGPCRMKEVSIVNCKKSSLSDWCEVLHHLTTLEKLKISECEELTHLPPNLIRQGIPSLRTLDIANNYNLNSLGEGVQGQPPFLFTSIHNLILRNCKSLVQIPGWFGGLNSLECLDLSACTKLGSLQHLEVLNQCQITLCTDLKRKLEEEINKDGHKDLITHATQENQPNEEEGVNGTQGKRFASNFERPRMTNFVVAMQCTNEGTAS